MPRTGSVLWLRVASLLVVSAMGCGGRELEFADDGGMGESSGTGTDGGEETGTGETGTTGDDGEEGTTSETGTDEGGDECVGEMGGQALGDPVGELRNVDAPEDCIDELDGQVVGYEAGVWHIEDCPCDEICDAPDEWTFTSFIAEDHPLDLGSCVRIRVDHDQDLLGCHEQLNLLWVDGAPDPVFAASWTTLPGYEDLFSVEIAERGSCDTFDPPYYCERHVWYELIFSGLEPDDVVLGQGESTALPIEAWHGDYELFVTEAFAIVGGEPACGEQWNVSWMLNRLP